MTRLQLTIEILAEATDLPPAEVERLIYKGEIEQGLPPIDPFMHQELPAAEVEPTRAKLPQGLPTIMRWAVVQHANHRAARRN